MFEKMQLLSDARIVLHLVTAEMMAMSGARGVDCEAALEESMGLPHVEVALMLRENRDGTIKGSLRSSGGIDVERIADMFGGGGHRHAAGFDLKNRKLEECCTEIMKIIKEEFR